MQGAILLHPRDNVATALRELRAGEEVAVGASGRELRVRLAEDIPFGHKFAIASIAARGKVRKYGEVIGEARMIIRRGAHVHVHNVASLRARR